MTMFAGMHPDSLGWGPVTLQSSFGLLRFAFFLVSIFASLLVASFFDLWHTDNVVEAWAEFTQTDLFTAKKALYLCLMVQMALYLLYTVVEVDWALLLVVIKIASMPDLSNMTPGQTFGATIYFLIFALKFAIIGAIYAYQQKEDAHPTAFAFSQMAPDAAGRG